LDNVTHTLFAITVGRTSLGRAGRGTTAALVLAGNAPDIDIVTAFRGGTNYLHWHRGPTHGPIGVVALGALSAAIAYYGTRLVDARRKPRAPTYASFPMLLVMSMMMVACHLLMDLPTSYGTRVLSPFDWHWYAFDWMPIVDVYLLIALAAGLLFGNRSADAKQRYASVAFVAMAAIYGVRAFAHHQALELAPRLFGPTLPAKCADAPDTSSALDVWPREVRLKPDTPSNVVSGFSRTGRRCLVEIAAMPTFTSPFDWRIVAQMSNSYEIHDVNVLDTRFREPAAEGEVFWRQSVRYPNIWTAATMQATTAPIANIFLGFSRFPDVRTFADNTGTTTVRFGDMRFASGFVAVEQRVRPFTVTVHLDKDGKILDSSLGTR